MRRLIVLVVILLALLGVWGIIVQYAPNLSKYLPSLNLNTQPGVEKIKIVKVNNWGS